MSEQLQLGSIWRERDKRFVRHVRVVAIPYGGTYPRVGIQTIDANDGRLITKKITFANPAAFGKRYEFVSQAAGAGPAALAEARG